MSTSRLLQRQYKRFLSTTTTTTIPTSSNNAGRQLQPEQQHQRRRVVSADRLIVIGSGVAGSTAALIAAETYRIPVTMLFAGAVPTDCNSYWAQGGIIYEGRPHEDSPELLVQDIHRAGAGLCVDAAVRKVATEGPARVRQLLLNHHQNHQHQHHNTTSQPPPQQPPPPPPHQHGQFANVPFDKDASTGELALCLEASHAAPRILHTADHTGRSITECITAAAARHPLITMQPNTVVTDLLHAGGLCVGVETLHGPPEFATRGTVLATGGLAGIYQHTTNPTGFNAVGSSVALAIRAGAETIDLEYVQFHPTALNIAGQPRFLLTEALRGEGAILRDAHGRSFAKEYHEAGELAPRDVVARAVFNESLKGPVYLDITHRDADWLHRRFPSIHQHLQQTTAMRLDLARDPLPIIPAAHYTCGGVRTNLCGQTTVPNLYAAGEAARTGLHGGNRLASTSLLEGLVFGAAVADDIALNGRFEADEATRVIDFLQSRAMSRPTDRNASFESSAAAEQVLQQVRQVMWEGVGVTRTTQGLYGAVQALEELQVQAAHYHRMAPSRTTAAARDAATSGLAVASAALANPRSAGAHYIDNDVDSDHEDGLLQAAVGH